LCDLRSHFVEKHNEQLSKFPRLIPHDIFVCTLCDRSFSRRQSLARHNKVQHDVIADFPLKRPREESEEPDYPRKRDRKLEQENFRKKVESYKECDGFPQIKFVRDLDEIPNENSDKSSDETDKLEEQTPKRISRKPSATNSGKVEIEFSTSQSVVCTQIQVQPHQQAPESRGDDVEKKVIEVENYFHSNRVPHTTCNNTLLDHGNSSTDCHNNNNFTSLSHKLLPDKPLLVMPRKFSRVQEEFTFSQTFDSPHHPQYNNNALLSQQQESQRQSLQLSQQQQQTQPTQLQPQPTAQRNQTFNLSKQKMSIGFLL